MSELSTYCPICDKIHDCRPSMVAHIDKLEAERRRLSEALEQARKEAEFWKTRTSIPVAWHGR